ncbi:prepilin peptidase [Pelomicrobium methylotrophicum]|uniref:Prepilin leader peptidase/N-methyltransferase n=1 Tax=Pelomicrobium methylotrophicum TaxID=2602750 RepID=A0A5C7F0D7_9PROT|nr:A24 family peptidase [Pelomicrobium methylotrophicum]TXF13155.1 prepilin peptidase [Pelomicrobium methylotrophicum]
MTITAVLEAKPFFLVSIAVLLGLMVGSFLNVVIHRLPLMLEREWRRQCAELRGEALPPAERFNLVMPRSHCPACGKTIGALENIPIVSWFVLRGRCSSCGAPISPRYPLVEGLTGLISGYCAWRFGLTLAGVGALIFCWALIALAFIDLDAQLLPDDITLPLLWLGLLLNVADSFTDLRSAVVGAAAGYLALWSVFWLFKLLTGKEGMGHGDFKLLAAIGAWLGWQQLPVVILLASAVGAVVGVCLIAILGRDRSLPIPFGPYLAGGGLVALFWGHGLTQAYLGLL